MAITTAVAPQHTVKLSPALKKKLLTECRIYVVLNAEAKVIEVAKVKARGVIDGLREQTGEKALDVDGYKVTLIEPVTSKLDRVKLLAAGVTESQLEMGTVTCPGKAYVKVSPPGAKGDD